jgi:hypothetical protein
MNHPGLEDNNTERSSRWKVPQPASHASAGEGLRRVSSPQVEDLGEESWCDAIRLLCKRMAKVVMITRKRATGLARAGGVFSCTFKRTEKYSGFLPGGGES